MKFTLGLGVVSSLFVSLASAVEITDVFTVQSGNKKASCDKYLTILDLWLEEASFSLGNAVEFVDNNYNEDSRLGRKIRKSMFTFFNVPQTMAPGGGKPKGTANTISKNINEVVALVNGESKRKKEDLYLFCGSDFLVQKSPEDVAQDFEGKKIRVKDKDLLIKDMPGYKTNTKKGEVPWWSGDNSDLNGYWFHGPNGGAKICDGGDLGLTGMIKVLNPAKNADKAPSVRQKTVMILCPGAFTSSKFKESFAAGAASIKEGDNLESALPRSATFTHEAFHVFHAGEFLAGGDVETYGLANCVDLAKDRERDSRKNPESYIYFSSAIHYLVDTDLSKKWDFCEDAHSARVFDPNSEDEEMGGT
ncbi:hypothetical protein V8F06_013497 [Rhypophila decipiens]